MKDKTIEIEGKRYQRLYYNTCCRCDLRTELTGERCPVDDCEDGQYFKEVKEK